MKNSYPPICPSYPACIFILLITFIPGIVHAQWDPEYWLDETKKLTVTDVRLNFDTPVYIGLEIRVLDHYYTIPFDDTFLDYPEDISGLLTEKAVAYLTSTTFGDVPFRQVLHDLTEHMKDHTASALVSVVLSVPSQNRGSLPFSLAMYIGHHAACIIRACTLYDLMPATLQAVFISRGFRPGPR
jgi:hypothetical protein